jgi:hypothetical protein
MIRKSSVFCHNYTAHHLQQYFQENEMDEKTKLTLTNLNSWKRGLFMVVFAIISGAAKLIVTLVAIFQFITLLIKGQKNEKLIPLGQNLSTYLYQITLFLTFTTNDMPFPFMDFPDGVPGSKMHTGNKENNNGTKATTKNEETIVEATDEKIEDEVVSNKNMKDDPFKG